MRTARLTRDAAGREAGAVVVDDFGPKAPPEGSPPGALRVDRRRFDRWVADGTLKVEPAVAEKMVPDQGETMVPEDAETTFTGRRRGRRGAPVPDLPVDDAPEDAPAIEEGEG